MGRFINADAFTSTGLELLGNNMFAYCGNNPVNCVDYSGHFWDLIDKINDALDKAEDAINKWIMDSIGAGATIEHETSYEKELVPVPLNAFFSVKKGMKTTHTTFEIGNSSKLLSLFAIGRSDNYLFSSVGGRVNVSNTSLDLSLGLDSTGISISHSRGITTNTMGVVLDLSQLKVGFEFSETVVSNNTLVPNVTQYTNISITGIGIMAAYQLLTTGQWDTTLVPKSAT